MRILVFGAGALGSLVGGLLSEMHEVWLYGRKSHMEAVGKNGLSVSGLTEKTFHPHASWDVQTLEEPKLAILTTKSYDTPEAASELFELLGPDTPVLSLQNGLGNLEALEKCLGAERVLGGVTSHGVTFVENGVIRHAGIGDTTIGALSPSGRGHAEAAARILSETGFKATVTDNILGEIWAKAIVNAAINPITALTGKRNGVIAEVSGLSSLAEGVCLECVEVAKTCKVSLPGCDLVKKTMGVVERTAANRSSMLQDIEKGRRTEIDQINGAFARHAKGAGVKTPFNDALVALVRAREKPIENRQNL